MGRDAAEIKAEDGRRNDALRRPGQVQPLARVLARVAGPALRKRGLTRAELLLDWSSIAGPYFAAHTSPLKLTYPRGKGDAGVLHLAVSPALATAVQHDAPRLVERINAWLGHRAIGGLRLVGMEQPPPAPPRIAPPPRPKPAGPAVAAVGDGPLRDALARLERHFADPGTDGRPL